MLPLETEEDIPLPKYSGIQLYLTAMLCGSLMKACSKMLMGELDLFLVLFFRMLVTSAITLTSMHIKKVEHWFWGPPGTRLLLFVRGSLGCVNIALTYFSLKHLSLPDQAAISFLTPLVTSIMAKFLLGEQYTVRQAAASAVSLLGVVVIAKPFGERGADPMRPFAVVATLCVVITASMVMIIIRKIKDQVHALATVATYSVQTVVLSSLVLTTTRKWSMPHDLRTWALVAAMGTFGFFLQFLSSKALQMEEASVLANFRYTQLVYATILEAIFWHDWPDWVSVLGISLIIAGLVGSKLSKPEKPAYENNNTP